MMELQRPLEQVPFSSNAEQERKKERRMRILQLSQPKMSKAVWYTIEPRLVYGNQEPMRPLSSAALNATPSARSTELATPKKNFQLSQPQKCCRDNFMYSCGRSSVIWQVSPLAMKNNANQRVEELAQPHKLPSGYQEDRPSYVLGCGRSSPLWGVSAAAQKSTQNSERVNALAEPKQTHREYLPGRDVQWEISATAKNCNIPSRVEILSRHKERNEGAFRHPQWAVSKSARNGMASNRVQELSQPKKLTDGYHPTRDVEWRVPRSALRAAPTERLKTLSEPIIRDTMDHVQFDPLAFQVKESALKGRVPNRIHDLAQPIIRGGNISKK